jgi:fructokinase
MTPGSTELFGGIEAGGTKFVCAVGSGAVGSGPDDLRSMVRIETTTPTATLGKVADFFKMEMNKGPLRAIGIGSFGPLDLDPASPGFGCISSTPKAGWSGTNLAGIIREELGIPVYLDTDVNAAALGEQIWGAARGLDNLLYLTVGTGIGGGAIINGRLLHGLSHPEMGHIRIAHDWQKDPFSGSCPFHGDCLEGLASGAAMQERWGRSPQEIPPEHPAWKLEAGYLASGIANLIFTLSPQKIVVGGGISKKEGLLSLVRHGVLKGLNNYLVTPAIVERIDSYIVSPALGDLAGVTGALALARGRESELDE